MVYRMEIYVDGGCRNNGGSSAYAAAAAIRVERGGYYWQRRERLTGSDATNQRAELTAIILGQKMALEKYHTLHSNPDLEVTIHSDSRYAVNCLTKWVFKWANNGWINAKGEEVVNRDLIKEASDLDDELADLGSVTYEWIPREKNGEADEACNEELDKMNKEARRDYYGYSSDSDESY